ncbi:hypothetical protein HPB51_019451 [Rhipicephalus microplus]|uniref:Uncharacterized protein n=1 Tax=Rhipicephalus microplus TaxID=6941 RepID=A0A9J6DPS0_RHIMP|nr:hypothetical protein HPB51_019451 [Rhipicephalus microplus]
MRCNRPGTRTPLADAETLTTTCSATGAISTLSGGEPSKNIGAPRHSPHMDPDAYVIVIKPSQTCNLKQYRGTGSIGNGILEAIPQRSIAAKVAQNLKHKYCLYPILEQNLVVIGNKDECSQSIPVSLEQFPMTNKAMNVQAYPKNAGNTNKGVIQLAHTFTTDYILAGQAHDYNQAPSDDHNEQQKSSYMMGNGTSARSSQPRSKKWAGS